MIFVRNYPAYFQTQLQVQVLILTGKNPHIRAEDISNEFDDSIDLIIDGGIINGSGSKIFLLDNDVWKQLR